MIEVEEDNNEREPEPDAPRTIDEGVEGAAERTRCRISKPLTHKGGDRVVGEEADEAPDRKCHKHKVGDRHRTIKAPGCGKPGNAGNQKYGKKEGEDDVPEGFHTPDDSMRAHP